MPKRVGYTNPAPTAYWWDSSPRERFWVEITDRKDIGADLHCPQTNDEGKFEWSYSLINHIMPGDIVFHYSTRTKRFEGASVASGPVEERTVYWLAHGTTKRSAIRVPQRA